MNRDFAACLKKIQLIYLLTEYMKYGHLVIAVPASHVWDRQWLKAKLLVPSACPSIT